MATLKISIKIKKKEDIMGKYYETPVLRISSLQIDDVLIVSTGEGIARDFNDWLENPFEGGVTE